MYLFSVWLSQSASVSYRMLGQKELEMKLVQWRALARAVGIVSTVAVAVQGIYLFFADAPHNWQIPVLAVIVFVGVVIVVYLATKEDTPV